ncbi:MAG: HipA N-terminal domain-containing protein [Candidatus Marinimicrobia bacterium]|nr:HipA N-terminal domain-containing protein [Candidatus Neomarinimicrobiota bacterium]
MRKSLIKIHNVRAGILKEESQTHYLFNYDLEYEGPPISLTMPVREEVYEFKSFPPFFDGLLPEGIQLEGLLKMYKIDKKDYFQQLLVTGLDLVGAVTIEKINRPDE